jgi:hypothetical protein
MMHPSGSSGRSSGLVASKMLKTHVVVHIKEGNLRLRKGGQGSKGMRNTGNRPPAALDNRNRAKVRKVPWQTAGRHSLSANFLDAIPCPRVGSHGVRSLMPL